MPSPPGLEVTDRIRIAVITAVFSVDALYDKLALKGGNALRLIYAIQDRTSLDLDFSLEGDLADFDSTRDSLFHALHDRLGSAGFRVFDERLTRRPPNATGTWGGYILEFKVIAKADDERLAGDVSRLRREAIVLSASQTRTWSVQISKYEFCEGKIRREIDDYPIFVYTPSMIVIEKLRALCQQMPEYPHRVHPAPRARDFYDIFETLQKLILAQDLKTPESVQLAHAIFAAKQVPLALLSRIRHTRDFHAPDWPSVEQSIVGRRYTFDVYFDFVVRLVEELEHVWVV
jgi:predicted nucleotidyltransferase component of viral defense system